MSKIKTETAGAYGVAKPAAQADDDAVIAHALDILERRLRVAGALLQSPDAVRAFLRLRMSEHHDEHFALVLLDSSHAVIGFEVLFRGTIDRAAVYTRGVAQCWLKHNAASCILVHNHPSGNTDPSDADVALTLSMIDLGRKLDVRILDHFIVAGAANHDHPSIVSLRESYIPGVEW